MVSSIIALMNADCSPADEGKRLTRPAGEHSEGVPSDRYARRQARRQRRRSQSVKLTVYVEGVTGELRDNVAAFLEINQPPPEPAEPEDSEQPDNLIEKSVDGFIEEVKKMAGEKEKEPTQNGQPPVGSFKLQVSERRLRWLHGRAEADIERALQPFGHYNPVVKSYLDRSENHWIATYKIDPGPLVKIDRANIRVMGDGAQDPVFQDLLASQPLVEGAALVQPRYEQLKSDLRRVAAERGYFDAEFEQNTIQVNPQTNKAAIDLIFDSGRRYRFGEITFTEGILKDSLLWRFVKFDPGEPYKSAKLQRLQSDLINSAYFDRVQVSTPRDELSEEAAAEFSSGYVPVNVELESRDNRRYDFGFGYGTDTGVRGSASFEHRRLNKSGHRLTTRLLASQIKYSLLASYEIPGADPTTDLYTLRTGIFREDSDVKDTFTAVVGLSWRTSYGLWDQTLSLDYGYESFRVQDRSESGLLIPGILLTRVDADDPVNITQGYRLDFRLRGAYEPLLSDVSFLQPRARGKLIHVLGAAGKLIVRGDFGTTFVSDFEQLPSSLRFFAGGDNSVRGYELDKIGPEDSDGNVKGGKSLIVGSLEYEHRLVGRWSAAAFVDSGDAFNFDEPDLKTGVGVGVRWQSPVGPVRVDFARALDRPPGDDLRLHFSFGPPL